MKHPVLFLLLIFFSATTFQSCTKNTSGDEETKGEFATVTTDSVYGRGFTSAFCSGSVSNDGGSTVIERGICCDTISDPVKNGLHQSNGSGKGSFFVEIDNLEEGTQYYARAYAVNSRGISYGKNIVFSTNDAVVKDFDGNSYNQVKIGNQKWLDRNLMVKHFANGDEIVNVIDAQEWNNLESPARCDYNNDTVSGNVYGQLYNWMAVDDSRKICPEGWHVPGYDEWMVLINFLGGAHYAGGAMKTTGISSLGTGLWVNPNIGGTNSSGFYGLPGGYRDDYHNSNFMSIGHWGCFWSSTERYSGYSSYSVRLKYSNTDAQVPDQPLRSGLSVRCVKD